MIYVSGILLTLSLILSAAPATQPASQEDEQAIRRSAAKYVEAFNRGDVDALVGQYAKDATYDEGAGPVLTGLEAMRKKFTQDFTEHPGTRMTIEIKSIRFARSRAIEVGVATLTPKEGDPVIVPYRAIHAKHDGQWLVTSVGPDVMAENAASAGPFEDLMWMVGSWRDSEENVDLNIVCTWTTNRRFLLRTFVVKDEDDGSELKVSEVIGWDPANQVLRSWVFDSDGGFGQATWRQRGDDWVISSKGTLPDGGRGSSVNVIHSMDANSYTWSSIDREVDGEMLPDVEDVKMVRMPETQPAADTGDGSHP